MHEGSITIRLGAELAEVDRLNRLVRQFGELHDLPSRSRYAVNLSIDEIMTNVVLYGFDNPAGQEVVVRVESAGGWLQCEVRDGGRAFNPLEQPAPNLTAPLEQREPGGLGIHLVRSLMDRVEYRREDGKNVLTMWKKIR